MLLSIAIVHSKFHSVYISWKTEIIPYGSDIPQNSILYIFHEIEGKIQEGGGGSKFHSVYIS